MNDCTQNEHAASDVLPSFHDAQLSGIVLLPQKRCLAIITTVNNQTHRIVFRGVERLRADDFREGNIILDVTVQSGKSVDKAGVLFALSMEDERRHPAFFDSVIGRIERGELMLVQVNPSYGCMFACLCSGWLVDPSPECDQGLSKETTPDS